MIAWVPLAPMSCTVKVSARVNPAAVTEAVSTAPTFESVYVESASALPTSMLATDTVAPFAVEVTVSAVAVAPSWVTANEPFSRFSPLKRVR